jgi:hypothetical protein
MIRFDYWIICNQEVGPPTANQTEQHARAQRGSEAASTQNHQDLDLDRMNGIFGAVTQI